MKPESKDDQKVEPSNLRDVSSGLQATEQVENRSSARPARWLGWPFGKSHRFNLHLQSSPARRDTGEDATGIKDLEPATSVAQVLELSQVVTEGPVMNPNAATVVGSPKPELSRSCETGRRAQLHGKLKEGFVVWARQHIKANQKKTRRSRCSHRRSMKKVIKGVKVQKRSDIENKDKVSREAAAAYIRDAFQRFQKLGSSPNAAAANALREMAGLAPVFKVKANIPAVPPMLLPPTSWGAFEPSATCDSEDAEVAPSEEMGNTMLDTQSTQLDPETQDVVVCDEQDLAATLLDNPCEEPEPIGAIQDSRQEVQQRDAPEKVKLKTRRSKTSVQSEAPSSRRTSRQRIPPLEHWKNERCVYERKSGSSVPSLAAVVKCSAEKNPSKCSLDQGLRKTTKATDSTSKRRRKDSLAAESAGESAAESADGHVTDLDDTGMVSLPMPSIYDIADKKSKKKSEDVQMSSIPKMSKVKASQTAPAKAGKASQGNSAEKKSGPISPPRGLMGALEAARMEAAKLRDIARPLATASASAPSLSGFRGKPSLKRMAAAAAAAVGNGPLSSRETAATDVSSSATKPRQRRAKK